MFFKLLLFLLALLNLQIGSSIPLSPADREPSTTLIGTSDVIIAPRQRHNVSISEPFIYPLPTMSSLALRSADNTGRPVDRRDTLHALTSLRVTLQKMVTTTYDRNDPIPLRTSRSNRYVHAEIGRNPSPPSDGPQDGKARAMEKVMTFDEGVQVIGGMYEMMKEHGFQERWVEVVEKAKLDSDGEKGGIGWVAVGFIHVTLRLATAPAPAS
ncbi:MAG: hypothetical protein Q9226_004098 [Calogaya cf. arnoldii]